MSAMSARVVPSNAVESVSLDGSREYEEGPKSNRDQFPEAKLQPKAAGVKRKLSQSEQDMVYGTGSKKYWNLDPNSPRQQKWDLAMAFLICMIAIFTPYEVSFLSPVFGGGLFMANRLVDACFVCDMVLQFFLPIQSGDKENKLIRDNKLIAAAYLKSWFFIDLVAVIPFDVVTHLSQSDEISNLRILRTVRLLRLAKLLRVVKSLRIFKRYQSRVTISFGTLSLAKYLVIVIILVHWCACFWHMIGDDVTSDANWIVGVGLTGASNQAKYSAAFYWATMTLTTIGYGDVGSQNATEQWVAIMVMFLGGGLYAYVVGGICGIFAAMNPEQADFHTSLDTLNALMKETRVQQELRLELRTFFRNCEPIHKAKYDQAVVKLMSPNLRRKFISDCYSNWVEAMSFMSGARSFKQDSVDGEDQYMNFITDLVLQMGPRAYPAREVVVHHGEMAREMFVIQSGLIGMKGKLFRTNECVGTDMVCGVQREYMATTLTFVLVMVLSRDQLLDVIRNGSYDAIKQSIYTRARWQRVRQSFMGLARTLTMLKRFSNNKSAFTFNWLNADRKQLRITGEGESSTLHKDQVDLLQRSQDPYVKAMLNMQQIHKAKASADLESSDIFGGQTVGKMPLHKLKEMVEGNRRAEHQLIGDTFAMFRKLQSDGGGDSVGSLGGGNLELCLGLFNTLSAAEKLQAKQAIDAKVS